VRFEEEKEEEEPASNAVITMNDFDRDESITETQV
jgi:hypothetical protein